MSWLVNKIKYYANPKDNINLCCTDCIPTTLEIISFIFYFPEHGKYFPKEKKKLEIRLSLKLPIDIIYNFFPSFEKDLIPARYFYPGNNIERTFL